MEISITKKQKQFCDAQAFEVLYGGAAGGGKSYGQLIDAFLYAMTYPRSKQIIFRRTLPELEKSLIRTSLSLYPQEVYSYRSSVHTGTFINGSLIDFAYCDSEDDVYKYQSAEYDVIRFDELTHFTAAMYLYLISRCRGTNGYPKQIKSTTNPGGIGHSWVKARFIDIGPSGREHRIGQTTRCFIPARVTENKFLMQADPDYLDRLLALDENDRRALLDGCWDLEGGRFFPSFDRNIHVCRERPAGKSVCYVALDYGLDMLAAYKIAVGTDGHATVLQEVYEGKDAGGDGLIVSEAAERIKALIGHDSVRAIFAPPDLWNRQKDSGKSIARLFYEQGITLTRVPNDRRSGWLELKEWLKEKRLMIHESCTNLIRAMGLIQCDRHDPSDCAARPHELTHAPDALRYFIAGGPRAPAEHKRPARYGFSVERPARSATGVGEGYKII